MNALETFLATADPKPIVWVLTIDTVDGRRTTLHTHPINAEYELLAYVKEHWEDAREYEETLPKTPADCEDPVGIYFDAMGWETESYQIDGLPLNP